MSTTIKQAIDGFLLSCKVEGKSYGTIECYSDKLKGFLWYCNNYDIPSDIGEVTTQHLSEFLAYLRDTEHRFNSNCPRAKKHINSTTIQKYYRALSSMFNFLIREEVLEYKPLVKIKVPRAEKKVIKALSSNEVNQIIIALPNTFVGKRNKAITKSPNILFLWHVNNTILLCKQDYWPILFITDIVYHDNSL